MKRGNKIVNKVMLIFLIVGALFAGVGLFVWNDTNNFINNALETEATIERIDERYHGDGDTDYDVYVSYFVDGKSYYEELNSYNSSMREGKNITIYYNPDDPSEIMSNDGSIIGIIFMVIGGIAVLITLIFFINDFKKKRKGKMIMSYGHLIDANIDDVFQNPRVRVNGVSPFVIQASTVGPDGATYVFKSGDIYDDTPNLIASNNIQKIKVYVNPSNYKEYVMDIESLNNYKPQ